MGKLARLIWVPVTLMLGACDVQVHDTTPAEMTANHDIGMYPVTATVTRDSMVTSGSVYLFAVGDNRRFNMSSTDGAQWQGLYEVRCKSSFPLQFLAEWRMTFGVKDKLVPPQPRMIKLNEPPLKNTDFKFEASGKEPKGGWQGSVPLRFMTQPTVRITDAHIEPATTDRADEAAAKPISVVTKLPLVVACGDTGEVEVASTAPHAHGVLIIDTDHPTLPHIRTTVEFSPPK